MNSTLLSQLPSLRGPKGRGNPFFEIASVASLPRNDKLRNRISKSLFRRYVPFNLDMSVNSSNFNYDGCQTRLLRDIGRKQERLFR